MALHLNKTRLFVIKDDKGDAISTLPDPDPSLTPLEVVRFYAPQHAKLISAVIGDQEFDENNNVVYPILPQYDDKG